MPSYWLRPSWCAICWAWPLPSAVRPGPGTSVSMIPSALAWDSACRMKVRVMLRACGDAAAGTDDYRCGEHSYAAFQIMLRLRMAIACPADGAGGKGLRWLAAEKAEISDLRGDSYGD